MKILVLQLARLGDIYQTWPALRAIQRTYPGAQIDVVVRPRFLEALTGCEVIRKKFVLPTPEIFEPISKFPQDVNKSLKTVSDFVDRMRAEKYDWIINYSFSPVSSYLVHAIKYPTTRVSGYSRHDDGFLNLEGEVASYFYAQVGIGKYNRFHVTELMSGIAGVDLQTSDWEDPVFLEMRPQFELPENYIVAHIGASESHKTMPAFKWARIFKYFNEVAPGTSVVLIGSAAERGIAAGVIAGKGKVNIVDLVGQTSLPDLFTILRDARLLVGCDSSPMHIASFTKTPCMNISIGNVNFWETGPRAPKSYIFSVTSAEEVVSEYIGNVMNDIIQGHAPQGLIRYVEQSPCYQVYETPEQRFLWELISALYLGETFPVADDLQFLEGCQKLYDINDVILEQLQNVRKVGIEKVQPILNRSDDVIYALGEVVPGLKVFTWWLKAERARIGPGALEKVLEKTAQMHISLRSFLRPYIFDESKIKEGGSIG